jgi:hypothetical protein
MIILQIGIKSIGDIGPLVTLIAVAVAYITLKANHDWNRRSFALQMGANWNKQTKSLIDDIETIMPGILKFGKDKRLKQINQEEAQKIFDSVYGENSKEWTLRTRFIHLLNEFEFIASAYTNKVGDQKIIEQSFKDIFIKWGFVLEHFINIYKEERNNRYPWGPFHSLYEKWTKENPQSWRRPTA